MACGTNGEAGAQSWGYTLGSVQGSLLVELGGPYGVLGMKTTVPSLGCQTEPTLSTPSWTLSLQQCGPGTLGQAVPQFPHPETESPPQICTDVSQELETQEQGSKGKRQMGLGGQKGP